MNMKKTMAALAAGAVAVSAMATTVSALQDTSLTYNLVKKYEVKAPTPHKATYEFTINCAALETETATTYVANADITEATNEVLYKVDDELTKEQFDALSDDDKAKVTVDTGTSENDFDDTYTVNAEITKPGTKVLYAKGATLTEAQYNALTTNDQDKVDVVEDEVVTDDSAYPTFISFEGSTEKIKSMVVKVASNEAGEQNKIYTYSTDAKALNYTDKLSNTGLVLTNELTSYTGALAITVTVNTETTYDKIEKINPVLNTGIVTKNDNATTITLKAFTKGDGNKVDEYYAPFKTEIKNNVNITAYLEARDAKPSAKDKDNITAKAQGYHNVGAVLNDAIENYESVTFTFNTATSGIIWTVENPTTTEKLFDKYYVANGKYGNDDKKDGGNYNAALAAASTPSWADDATILAYYSSDWFADTSYMSFDQHLYQGTKDVYGTYGTSYGSEATGYTGFDWTGYNLFQGALVINENLTMSLAETDYFDWTATSLSFDWDAIMDGAMTSNDYAVYLHSMKLATSNTWYWDNMVVTLTAGAAEDGVDAEAGVEADDEELAEEEVEEEVVEEEVEEEVEVEVANPTTGNASVALAVIPVALAAAAVVAKKRS